jgi:hypothetical protein
MFTSSVLSERRCLEPVCGGMNNHSQGAAVPHQQFNHAAIERLWAVPIFLAQNPESEDEDVHN